VSQTHTHTPCHDLYQVHQVDIPTTKDNPQPNKPKMYHVWQDG